MPHDNAGGGKTNSTMPPNWHKSRLWTKRRIIADSKQPGCPYGVSAYRVDQHHGMFKPWAYHQRSIGMYFPPRFDHKLSMQMGNLVEMAYDRFQSLEVEGTWRLPEAFQLIREIKYSSIANGIIDKDSPIGQFILKIPLFKDRKINEIPIGFVARHKRALYIIFRGTQNSTEWINNLNARLTPFFINDHGSVHDGFLSLYLDVRDDLLEVAKSFSEKNKIHVAGHSLGATLAVFAACDIESTLGLKIASLYTFGSPRIGDNAFAIAFNQAFAHKSFRIANSSDMVTEVPFPSRFAGFFGGYFSHIETPVIFTVQENDNIKNHQMATYLAALAGCRRNPVRRFLEIFG